MSDVVSRIRRELEERCRELEPAVDEYNRLRRLLESIDDSGAHEAGHAAEKAPRHATSRPARKARSATRTGAGRKPRGGASSRRTNRAPRGQRREQVLEALSRNGGAGARTVATELGISENQVYNLIRKLRDEGLVKKTKQGTWAKT